MASQTDPATYATHSEDASVQRAGVSMKDDVGDYKLCADGPNNGLAGIGNVCGSKLHGAGYKRSYNVLSQFLALDMSEELFCEWLHDVTDGKCTKLNQEKCFAGMYLYCKNNL